MKWDERIGRRIRPRDLHVFMAVAEHGTMAKAADALAISRPVISKSIAELERTLGVPLFDRGPAGIAPTLYGRALLRRSVTVFNEIRQGVEEIQSLADPGTGEARVGCTAVLAAGIVAAAIARLSRRFPRLSFHVEQGILPSLPPTFLRERRGEVVVARLLGTGLPSDLEAEPLFHDHLRVVCGPGNRWARRRSVALADLADDPWILAPAEIAPGGPVHAAFRAIGREPPATRVLSTSISFRRHLLATGRFVTCTPISLLRFETDRGAFVPLPIAMPPWDQPIAIITLKGRTLSPAAQRFVECIREVVRPLASGGEPRRPGV